MTTLILLADIHANLGALEAVLADAEARCGPEALICQLGDLVDYGPRPNEVTARLAALGPRLAVSLAGNHEQIVFGRGLERLSSDRGRESGAWTIRRLSSDSRVYLAKLAPGSQELTLAGKRFLFVHGDLGDVYWGRMDPDERRRSVYQGFDYVISGHSHIPHLDIVVPGGPPPSFESALQRTVFINPGSVGQPRDRDPRAHYALLEPQSGRLTFEAVPYDIAAEAALFDEAVPSYYRQRLFVGI